MYSTIMVPTDGSGFDREAIRVALRIAERSDAKVRLVRVLSTASLFGVAAASEGTAIAAEVVQSERDKALSELYALAAECRSMSKGDISVDLHSGPVADVLEHYAQRHDIDLIVISTHARSGISRLSLGSVTDWLIRHTSIPVLVVKPPTSYLNPQVGEAFKRVVVPLDGSTLAEQILPRILTLARLEDAELILLHVLPAPSLSQKEIADLNPAWWKPDIEVAKDYLIRMARMVRRNGVPVRTEIVINENVANAIADFASHERADLIAIATHGRGGVARMLRGSVADAIMHSGRASMLVFKPEKPGENEATTSADWVRAELIPA
ncbi:MAG TPA: universal stress protein [Gemmatimonadaceae bacterium]|nr:universal stress protein [Gemmatimonadaceae bacterium]